MRRSFKALLAAVLIAVPMLASCNDAQNPISPTTNIERQDGLIDGLLGGVVNTVGGVVKLLGSVLSGPDANGEAVSAWIGSEGGTLRTAAYTIVVPEGAVTRKTQFEIWPLNNGTYTVELKAYQQGLLGKVDVGVRGFQKPVELRFSYAQAQGITDLKRLGIIYIESPDRVELQKVWLDTTAKIITAPLSHFSKYAMVQN
ncbi:MAG TPA: hypothetical protein VGD49_06495 [Longimicrobiales bacterium]